MPYSACQIGPSVSYWDHPPHVNRDATVAVAGCLPVSQPPQERKCTASVYHRPEHPLVVANLPHLNAVQQAFDVVTCRHAGMCPHSSASPFMATNGDHESRYPPEHARRPHPIRQGGHRAVVHQRSICLSVCRRPNRREHPPHSTAQLLVSSAPRKCCLCDGQTDRRCRCEQMHPHDNMPTNNAFDLCQTQAQLRHIRQRSGYGSSASPAPAESAPAHRA
jgi:hypothetical protein